MSTVTKKKNSPEAVAAWRADKKKYRETEGIKDNPAPYTKTADDFEPKKPAKAAGGAK